MKLKKIAAAVMALVLTGSASAYAARHTQNLSANANLFGDINGDGSINAVDAALLLEYAAFQGAGGNSSLEAWLNNSTDMDTDTSAPSLPSTDPMLTVVCWTDADLAYMFDVYSERYPDAELVYRNCGDNGTEASTKYAAYLNSGDDADLYIAEAGWILNYINDDQYSVPLASLGIADSEYADAYPFTVEVGRDSNGVLKAASWQVAAGCYAYNATLASRYLGVSTPAEMQAKISDWDDFELTAQMLKTASAGRVTITATLGGMWTAYSSNATSWVNGTALNTSVASSFTEMAKRFANNGYIDPSIEQWTTDWTNAGVNDRTLGYFYASWCLPEGAQLDQNSNSSDTWKVVKGPQSFYWGGSWLCVSPTCNTAEEAARFVRSFTTDADMMKKYALYSGDFVNHQKAMQALIDEGINANVLLGGQDPFPVLAESAADIRMAENITKYDQDLKDTYIQVLKSYIDQDTSVIMDKFCTYALDNHPELHT